MCHGCQLHCVKNVEFQASDCKITLEIEFTWVLKTTYNHVCTAEVWLESTRDHHEQSPIKICQLVFKVSGYACTRYNFHEYEFLDKDIIGESKIFVGCSI